MLLRLTPVGLVETRCLVGASLNSTCLAYLQRDYSPCGIVEADDHAHVGSSDGRIHDFVVAHEQERCTHAKICGGLTDKLVHIDKSRGESHREALEGADRWSARDG